jgi:hypothetical protein
MILSFYLTNRAPFLQLGPISCEHVVLLAFGFGEFSSPCFDADWPIVAIFLGFHCPCDQVEHNPGRGADNRDGKVGDQPTEPTRFDDV